MMTNDTQAVLFTVTEVCERLHLSRPKVYELINTGQLRGFKVGRVLRVPIQAVGEYVDNMLAGAESGPGAA